MVKANAYGHHIDLITPIIDNADVLAVSNLTEAQALRAISQRPILLLSGVYSVEELQQAQDLNCQVVVHHSEQIPLINTSTKPLSVWIKIDTGMHRLGLSADEYRQCCSDFEKNSFISVEYVMSHFACANELNHALTDLQIKTFNTIVDQQSNRSMANSAAILSLPEAIFDIVRPGIMLYGASPFANNTYDLKPVMQLSASIISIKTIQAGQGVGYGVTWTASKQSTIATIGIGYGDGYPRHTKNGTPVLINEVLCPLVGRVSMDMIAVDVTACQAKIGDKAILWGDEKLRVETVAKYSNTIGYELLTSVSERVKFVAGE
ncbi:Alanine racemase [uncultured Candidatus Thioglobus sp.]|nr:Alanine racemase [uncultured Candidatus Thioglobus sp.]